MYATLDTAPASLRRLPKKSTSRNRRAPPDEEVPAAILGAAATQAPAADDAPGALERTNTDLQFGV